MLRQDTGMSCTQSNHGRGRGAREENGIPKKRKTLGDVMEQNGCNAERMKKWADLLYPMFVTSGVRLSSGGEHDNVASMRDFTGWHPGDSRRYSSDEVLRHLMTLLKTDLISIGEAIGLNFRGRKRDISSHIAMFLENFHQLCGNTRTHETPAHSHVPTVPARTSTTSSAKRPKSLLKNYNSRSTGLNCDFIDPDVLTLSVISQLQKTLCSSLTFRTDLRKAVWLHVSGTFGDPDIDSALKRINFVQQFSNFAVPDGQPICVPKFLYYKFGYFAQTLPNNYSFYFTTPADISTEDFDYQVHLRFLKIDVRGVSSKPVPFIPPYTCTISVGENKIPTPPQSFAKRTQPMAEENSINITPFLKKRPESNGRCSNILEIRGLRVSDLPPWTAHLVFIQGMKVQSIKGLTEEVRKQTRIHIDRARSILCCAPTDSDYEVFKKLAAKQSFSSDGIVIESLRLSLKCPLSLLRIRIPAKGFQCEHVQCFDLEKYLEYIRRSRRSECPVCNRKLAEFSKLLISPLYEYALKEFPNVEEVDLLRDGTLQAANLVQRSTPKRKPSVEILIDDENSTVALRDDEDDIPLRNLTRVPPATLRVQSPFRKRKEREVIDLTDDNDVQMSRRPLRRRSVASVSDLVIIQAEEDLEANPFGNNGRESSHRGRTVLNRNSGPPPVICPPRSIPVTVVGNFTTPAGHSTNREERRGTEEPIDISPHDESPPIVVPLNSVHFVRDTHNRAGELEQKSSVSEGTSSTSPKRSRSSENRSTGPETSINHSLTARLYLSQTTPSIPTLPKASCRNATSSKPFTPLRTNSPNLVHEVDPKTSDGMQKPTNGAPRMSEEVHTAVEFSETIQQMAVPLEFDVGLEFSKRNNVTHRVLSTAETAADGTECGKDSHLELTTSSTSMPPSFGQSHEVPVSTSIEEVAKPSKEYSNAQAIIVGEIRTTTNALTKDRAESSSDLSRVPEKPVTTATTGTKDRTESPPNKSRLPERGGTPASPPMKERNEPKLDMRRTPGSPLDLDIDGPPEDDIADQAFTDITSVLEKTLGPNTETRGREEVSSTEKQLVDDLEQTTSIDAQLSRSTSCNGANIVDLN